jgi:hypothetical protein
MNEAEMEAFRYRVRVKLLEEIVLKTAFLASRLDGRLSIGQTAQALKDNFDATSALADRQYGAAFQDPALAGLYSDEIRAVADEMKKAVDKIAKAANQSFG